MGLLSRGISCRRASDGVVFFVVEVIERGCATGLSLGYIFGSFIEFTERRQWEGGNRKKNLRKEISFFEGWGYGGRWGENRRLLTARTLIYKLLVVNDIDLILNGSCRELWWLWRDILGKLIGAFLGTLGRGFEWGFG